MEARLPYEASLASSSPSVSSEASEAGDRPALPPFYIFSFLSPFSPPVLLPSLTSPLEPSHVLAGKEIIDWSTCPICLQVLCRPVWGPCQHVACGGCFVGTLQRRQKCPVCNSAMKASDLECMRPLALSGAEAASPEDSASPSLSPCASPSSWTSQSRASSVAGSAADDAHAPSASVPSPATTAAVAVSAAAAATATAMLAGSSDAVLNALADVKDGAAAALSGVLAEEEGDRERHASAREDGRPGASKFLRRMARGCGDEADERATLWRIQKCLREERKRSTSRQPPREMPCDDYAEAAEEAKGACAAGERRRTEPDHILKICDAYYQRVIASQTQSAAPAASTSSFASSALGASFASAISVTSTLYWRLILRCELCGEVLPMHKYDAHRRSSCSFCRCRFAPFGCNFVAKVRRPALPSSSSASSFSSPPRSSSSFLLSSSARSASFSSAASPRSSSASASQPGAGVSGEAASGEASELDLRVHERSCPHRLIKCPCCFKYCTECSSSVLVPLAEYRAKGTPPPRTAPAAPAERREDGEFESAPVEASEEGEGGARAGEGGAARGAEGLRSEAPRPSSARALPEPPSRALQARGRRTSPRPRSLNTSLALGGPQRPEILHRLLLQQQDLPRAPREEDRMWFTLQRESSFFATSEDEEVELSDAVGRAVFGDLQQALDYLLDREEEIENRIERLGVEPRVFTHGENGQLLVCSADCIVKEPQRLRVELHEALALLGVTWAVGFPLAFLLGAASSFWSQKAATFLDIAVPYLFSIVSGWLMGFLQRRPIVDLSLQHE
ncbi:hypothetical protein BESB_009600 [Besnoitia besnoiti]|uniref:RING-type domain-containing protein n=1 Tax=Besnoitia besnoiti TaxID=94643 RepID=A0A2A9MJ96_BESBE|nr:hypothetical protein BESB_009600 [Besnoitia besnoiti]PFH38618.1 hypothetical protein BESB_009600 [Besnoitia besnoiti]